MRQATRATILTLCATAAALGLAALQFIPWMTQTATITTTNPDTPPAERTITYGLHSAAQRGDASWDAVYDGNHDDGIRTITVGAWLCYGALAFAVLCAVAGFLAMSGRGGAFAGGMVGFAGALVTLAATLVVFFGAHALSDPFANSTQTLGDVIAAFGSLRPSWGIWVAVVCALALAAPGVVALLPDRVRPRAGREVAADSPEAKQLYDARNWKRTGKAAGKPPMR